MLNPTQPDGLHQYWKSEFLPGLSDDLLDTYRAQAAGIASPLSQVILFQLGGALADRDPGAAAFGHRDAEQIFFSAGTWRPDAPRGERHRAWARSAWEAIRPYSTGGNYINAQTADEDETRMWEAYGGNLHRLAEIKAVYDPENLFRVNRNISIGPGGHVFA